MICEEFLVGLVRIAKEFAPAAGGTKTRVTLRDKLCVAVSGSDICFPKLAKGLEMALHWDQTPKKQGLYDPSMESDACGVGAVMDMQRKPSRKTLTDARDMVVRMEHRGAKQAHEDSAISIQSDTCAHSEGFQQR